MIRRAITTLLMLVGLAMVAGPASANQFISPAITVTNTTTSTLVVQQGSGLGGVYFVDVSAIGAGDTWTFKLQYTNAAGTATDITGTSSGVTATGTTAFVLASPFTGASTVPIPTHVVATRSVNGGAPTVTYKIRGFLTTSNVNASTIAQTLQVCKGGCRFSTIQSALDAIGTPTATSRFTVNVGPGDYAEDLTISDSYVSIVGADRNTTRIMGSASGITCNGSPGAAICVAADITGLAFSNIWLANTAATGIPIVLQPNTVAQTEILFSNVVFGISDNATTGDDIFSQDTSGDASFGHIVTVQDAIAYTKADVFILGVGDVWRVNDLRVSSLGISGTGQSTNVFRETSTVCGLTIIADNIQIYATAPGTLSIGSVLSLTGQTNSCTNSTGNYISLNNITYVKRATNSYGTNSRCIYFGSTPTVAAASTVELNNVNCDASTTSGTGTVNCIETDSDTDYAAWTLNWNSGSCSMVGGATRNAFDLASANAAAANAACASSGSPYVCCTGAGTGTCLGFVTNVRNVMSVGSVTGSGVINYFNMPMSNGQSRLTAIATAPATCSIGDTYADTSGAYCSCSAANTWTNMNGVGTCV